MKWFVPIIFAFLFGIPDRILFASSDKETLLAIGDMARDNSSKFTHGSISFTQSDGFNSNFEEARLGHLDQVAVGKGSYRYNEQGRAFYELRFPLETLQKTEKQTPSGSFLSRINSYQRATNGALTLEELFFHQRATSSMDHAISFQMGHESFYRIMIIPMNLGFPDDERGDVEGALRRAALGTRGVRLVSMNLKQMREGRPNAKFVLEAPPLTQEFWVDLERGATMTYSRLIINGVSSLEIFNDRVEFVPNHGWLPLVQTYSLDGRRYQNVALDHYDFDVVPETDAFTVTLLNPRSLLNPATMATTPVSKTFNLDRLPARFLQSTPAAIAERQATTIPAKGDRPAIRSLESIQPPLGGELEQPPTSPWITLVLLVIGCVCFGVVAWYKKRR